MMMGKRFIYNPKDKADYQFNLDNFYFCIEKSTLYIYKKKGFS